MNIIQKPKLCTAFTVADLLAVMIVVFVFVAVFLPALVPRRARVRSRISCVNNLKQVGLAFRMWSDDNNSKYPMAYAGDTNYPLINYGTNWQSAAVEYEFTVFESMSNELSTPKFIVCPQDKRIAATNFTTDLNSSHVSYFVGLDAEEIRPGSFLAGDWNLTNGRNPVKGILNLRTNQNPRWTKDMHNQNGNVAMGDGSVLQMNNSQLKTYLVKTGLGTNTLLFP
jgi:prepilin-type processing-associated H-X9-DG protein